MSGLDVAAMLQYVAHLQKLMGLQVQSFIRGHLPKKLVMCVHRDSLRVDVRFIPAMTERDYESFED